MDKRIRRFVWSLTVAVIALIIAWVSHDQDWVIIDWVALGVAVIAVVVFYKSLFELMGRKPNKTKP